MRRLLAILLLAVWSFAAQAQAVDVRSGEHAEFSRLVLQTDGAEWQFARDGDTYVLTLAADDVTFNMANLFARMSRNRIRSVDATGNQLRITVADDVHADVFDLAAGRTVIDIKNGPPPAGSAFETPYAEMAAPEQDEPVVAEEDVVEQPQPETEVAEAPAAEEQLPDVETSEAEAEAEPLIFAASDTEVGAPISDTLFSPAPAPALELPVIFDRPASLQLPTLTESGLDRDLAAESARSERAAEFGDQLAEQIGRAVAEGLLEVDLKPTEEIVEKTQVAETSPAGSMSAPEEEETAADIPRTHLKIDSAIVDSKRFAGVTEPSDPYGNICLDDRLTEVQFWGEPVEMGLQISTMRSRTVGEFDRADPEGVAKLAKYYIYLSFGAEALAVMEDFGVEVENADILRTLADIMDNGFARNAGRLAAQYRCDGYSALWSALAMPRFEDTAEFNVTAIRATFSELPPHLRRLLGPSLSERFLAAGDEKTARALQAAIERVGGDEDDAFKLLDSELSLTAGDIAAATATMQDIIAADGPNAPEALIRLVDAKVATGDAVSDAVAEQAEALAYEFRTHALGPELARAALLAKIQSGHPSEAIAALLSAPSAPGENADVMALALTRLASSTSDLEFARTAVGRIDDIIVYGADGPSFFQTANRLTELGLYTQAQRLLAATTHRDDSRPLLEARLALALGQPDVALERLANDTSAEATEIKMQALVALDDPAAALMVAGSQAPSELKADLAFLAGDLAGAANEPESQYAAIAQSVSQTPELGPTNAAGAPALGSAGTLLEQSAMMRAAVADLLD